jgi:hypothetical protein
MSWPKPTLAQIAQYFQQDGCFCRVDLAKGIVTVIDLRDERIAVLRPTIALHRESTVVVQISLERRCLPEYCATMQQFCTVANLTALNGAGRVGGFFSVSLLTGEVRFRHSFDSARIEPTAYCIVTFVRRARAAVIRYYATLHAIMDGLPLAVALALAEDE